MTKFIFFISVLAFAGCSFLPDIGSTDIKAINTAEQNAKNGIAEFADQEIARAKNEIGNAVSCVISKADSTLTKQLDAVEKSINTKAEETSKALSGKILAIEDDIKKAKAIGFIGIVIGLLGVVCAAITYKKKLRLNIDRVEDLILEEIRSNDIIRREIRRITGAHNPSRPSVTTASQSTIDRAIETYMASKNFRDVLQQYVSKHIVQVQAVEDTIKRADVVTPIVKQLHYIYAKESSSMVLSSIQDTYQKGKSIYKLIMTEQNASIAEVSICVEQEEVKQRILKFDSQYLEPICTVIRSSNEPTQVVVKNTGMAERVGDEWNVVRPIVVEIK